MRSRWLGVGAALVAALVSAVFWSRLPEQVPTHWNLKGEPDDWATRTGAALLGPALILGVTLLGQILPRIDPRRANYPGFQRVYWLVINGLALLLLVVHIVALASAAGLDVRVPRVLAGALALLMLVFGNYMGRIRPNWFMGIRTPWTLDSEEVWRKTHRLAGWLFVAAGLIAGLAALSPVGDPLVVVLVATLTAAILPAVLSLVFWLRERRS